MKRTIATPGYTIRLAQPGDASVLALHRALMFRDMNALTEAALDQHTFDQLLHSSTPWFERLLVDREYIGWLTLHDEAPHNEIVVSSGGIHLREQGPLPACLRTGRWGHIANVYTAPEHRGRGLARALISEILSWAKAERLDRITLTASKDGASLYRSLGFTPTADMELRPKDNSSSVD
ncbi:MAG: GNAT family N-acetyltransferase [Edaphobacter sp.]|uniref:GNAT family N-acetyltransferase n=1 Tax=Edaphobacter sp. TaxID=1934404 RepID=UPI002395EF8B|nr:GNAT family N-acetyltransferase [Edaphobacter sp.]MDE1175886.1 GNAT family N-acetyltransferase [Edaphobacter sp.]